jgi:methionyl-tRNA formyltransferase
MRAVFIGAVEFSSRVLEHLIVLGIEVVGICTKEVRLGNSDQVDLSLLGVKYGIDVWKTTDINAPASEQWIKMRSPDLIFCIGWHQLLGNSILDIAPQGVVGFHPTALPLNRGRHPIIWTLALGIQNTASTFFKMDVSADSGAILSQVPFFIEEDWDSSALYEKITEIALPQLTALVPKLIDGSAPLFPQEITDTNIWRKRTRFDGAIDWRMSGLAIDRLVKALTKPYPGATFTFRDKEFTLWKAQYEESARINLEPGKVIESSKQGPLIKCGEGAIRLIVLEPEIFLVEGDYL